MFKLSPKHREALILVGASGFSYEQAATICNCAIGTMKSRVARARGKLGRVLSIEVHSGAAAEKADENLELVCAGVEPVSDT